MTEKVSFLSCFKKEKKLKNAGREHKALAPTTLRVCVELYFFVVSAGRPDSWEGGQDCRLQP